MPADQRRLLGYSLAAAVVIVLVCWACGALQSLIQHIQLYGRIGP
jgi:hypothetical protein